MSQTPQSPTDEESFGADITFDLDSAPRGDAPMASEEVSFYHRITTDLSDKGMGPVRGLDVGTTNVVATAEDASGHSVYNAQRNAFIDVKSDTFTKKMLLKLGIEHYISEDRGCVIGDPAFELANIFEKDIQRPMQAGIISPGSKRALPMLELIIERILGKAVEPGQVCTVSVPADPVDSESNVIYHRGSIQNLLRELGYEPNTINQAEAVTFAELEDEEYTGIGISCGGGMFNVCVSYKSIPAITFAIGRGGDWIDSNIARALGVPNSQICAEKEAGVDLRAPRDQIEEAIVIYYQSLIRYTIETIREKFARLDDIPHFGRPVSMVCAGGSSLIKGFIDLFREELELVDFPVPLSEVRLAKDPLRTVATGCLKASQFVNFE
jgi:actin-like ATPase involved in cell morphogenesis